MMTSHGSTYSRPHTSQSRRPPGPRSRPSTRHDRQKPPTLPSQTLLTHFTCNLCSSLLSSTVYRTTCDCLFCEDCTWRHFESSADCPRCGRRLGEDDFTEVVVGVDGGADGGVGGALVSMLGSSGSGARGESAVTNPPGFAPACKSLMSHLSTLTRTTHFLLRQMVMSANAAAEGGREREEEVRAVRMDLDNKTRTGREREMRMEAENKGLRAKLKAAEDRARRGGGGGDFDEENYQRGAVPDTDIVVGTAMTVAPPARQSDFYAPAPIRNQDHPPRNHHASSSMSLMSDAYHGSRPGTSLSTGSRGSNPMPNAPRIRSELTPDSRYSFGQHRGGGFGGGSVQRGPKTPNASFQRHGGRGYGGSRRGYGR